MRRFPTDHRADHPGARRRGALVKLDRLQAVSEGRYDTLISALRAAINDVKQSAVKASDSATAAGQQRQDTLQRLSEELGTAEAAAGRPVPAAWSP